MNILKRLSAIFPFISNSKLKQKIKKHIIILLLFALITFITFPTLFYSFSSIQLRGDLVNIVAIVSYVNNTVLNQVYHLPILYPSSYTLAKTHPLFGIAFFYKIFDVFGLTLQQSTSLFIILSLVLGAYGSFLLSNEISRNTLFSILFAVLFIIHPIKNIHFVWLNFLSIFYIPYIFYFIIKFYKTKKKKYAVLSALFSLLQFLSSVYIGFILYGIFIPFLLLFSLILRIVSLKDMRFLILMFLLTAIIILIIYSPFILHNKSNAKAFDNHLVRAKHIFTDSKIISSIYNEKIKTSPKLFPGFIFTFFTLIPFVYYVKKKKVILLLISSVLIMTCAVYINLLFLDIFLLIFLFFLVFLIIKSWKYFDKWIKLSVLLLSTYFMFFFQISQFGFEQPISLFGMLYSLIPIGGLREIKRAALMVLPFFIVFATVGADKYFTNFNKYSKKTRYIIFLILLFFLLIENKKGSYVFHKPKHFIKKTQVSINYNNVYKKIPYKKNKILLELPFYFRIKNRNSMYFENWKYHKNITLNGKISIIDKKYFRELFEIIGLKQNKLSNETLRKLINNYSVNYIVVHLELLSDFIKMNRNIIKKEYINMIKELDKYAEIVYINNHHIVIKIQEKYPLKKILRTYSYYHLKNNRIELKLSKNYTGIISLFLNKKLIKTINISADKVIFDLSNNDINFDKNTLEIVFENKIILNDISIIDK